MEQCEENSQENDDVIIEKEISKLIEEQRLLRRVYMLVCRWVLKFMTHMVCCVV